MVLSISCSSPNVSAFRLKFIREFSTLGATMLLLLPAQRNFAWLPIHHFSGYPATLSFFWPIVQYRI
jgi:hypothetical protein